MIASQYSRWFPFVALTICIAGALRAGADSVSLRLLAITRVGDSREVMISSPDGKPLLTRSASLPTGQLSPQVEVAGRALAFRTATSDPQPLGKVDLPAAGKDFLLIFLPSVADAALPCRVIAVPFPREKFRSGDQAFFNCCGSAVGFTIGGEKLLVPDGGLAVYHPKDTAGSRVMVGYRQQADGEWETRPFFSSRLIVQDGVRNFILIFRDPRTGIPDFRGIADFVKRP